jgi:hypothetical protein
MFPFTNLEFFIVELFIVEFLIILLSITEPFIVPFSILAYKVPSISTSPLTSKSSIPSMKSFEPPPMSS